MANPTLTFKSNLPNLTVLKIGTQDLMVLQETVRKKIRQAPMMFIGMQVVIDVSEFDKEETLSLDLAAFKDFLMGESINPIAVMSNRSDRQKQAVSQGLGALPTLVNATAASTETTAAGSRRSAAKSTELAAANAVSETPTAIAQSEEPKKTFDTNERAGANANNSEPESRTIRHSIRSGQSVYVQGDLTVIGSVSPGAEVIADGNIHIYGTLRGRAIAGAQGDTAANIFCQQLDAELVAIAGNYKQMEDIDSDYQGKTLQISLENEKICFFPL